MYYIVKSYYWRRAVPNVHDHRSKRVITSADRVDQIKKIEDCNPLIARKKAFEHYNSIIDVLYQGLSIPKRKGDNICIDMQAYLDSGNGVEYKKDNSKLRFKMNSYDQENEIAIYCVHENTKLCIHGVFYLDYIENIKDIKNEIYDDKTEELKLYNSFFPSLSNRLSLKKNTRYSHA